MNLLRSEKKRTAARRAKRINDAKFKPGFRHKGSLSSRNSAVKFQTVDEDIPHRAR